MAYKLIAIDIDGTLTTNTDDVSSFTKEVLQRAVAQGIRIVLTTGRGMERLQPVLDQLQLNEPLICNNGAEIRLDGKNVWQRTFLPLAKSKEILSIVLKENVKFWGFTEEMHCESFKNNYKTQLEKKWMKIGVATNDLLLLSKIRTEVAALGNVSITSSDAANFEVMNEGITKAEGLRILCEELGIQLEEVMALGDSFNDLEMFEAVGFPVAMDNAIDELKQCAKAVTACNEQDGVAKAVEKYCLNVSI